MRRLLVALLVLLAGCNGLTGPERTETLTPVDPLPPAQTYPPGVTEQGVTDPGLLAATHQRELTDTSYTLRSNRTVRYGNGSLRSHLSIRVTLAENRTYHSWIRTAGPEAPVLLGRPPASAEFWGDGETFLRTLNRDNTTVYNEITGGDRTVVTWRYWTQTAAFGGRSQTASKALRDVLDSFRPRIEERWESNGTTRYRLVSDTIVTERFQPPSVTAVRDGSLRVTVTGTGVIESVQLSYVGTVEDQRVVVTREIRYDEIGTTDVGRPVWAGRALNQSS